MREERFKKIVDARVQAIRDVLTVKAREYSSRDDRLHNFRTAAVVMDSDMPNALWGMAMKHLVSVLDIIKSPKHETVSKGHCDEKIGDMINYLILLEAVLAEKREQK